MLLTVSIPAGEMLLARADDGKIVFDAARCEKEQYEECAINN
jgi:hypothetical protein